MCRYKLFKYYDVDCTLVGVSSHLQLPTVIFTVFSRCWNNSCKTIVEAAEFMGTLRYIIEMKEKRVRFVYTRAIIKRTASTSLNDKFNAIQLCMNVRRDV